MASSSSSLCAIFLPLPSVSATLTGCQRSINEAMDLADQRATQIPGRIRAFPERSFGKPLASSSSLTASQGPFLPWKMLQSRTSSSSSSPSSSLMLPLRISSLLSSPSPMPLPPSKNKKIPSSPWPSLSSPPASLPSAPSLFEENSREQEGELMPLPRAPKNNADDVSLHNPLLRSHRMGCGWLGVIIEWDGVIVEDSSKTERETWLALSLEEGRRPPPAFLLRKLEGMKSEQAVSEVLCWSRDPKELRRLAQRKEDLFQELQGGIYQLKLGSLEFLKTLKKYKVPIALASTRPRKAIEKAVESVGLEDMIGFVIAAEDVYRGKPDPEMYMYAAQLLGIIPERCIVIGNSNSSVEAAHDTFMKCIAVSGKHPIYELGAADLAVSRLDNLSFVDLKNLADLDSPEFQQPEPQIEVELEEEPLPQTRVALADRL